MDTTERIGDRNLSGLVEESTVLIVVFQVSEKFSKPLFVHQVVHDVHEAIDSAFNSLLGWLVFLHHGTETF